MSSVQDKADAVLDGALRRGFDAAMVEVSVHTLAELNAAHNEPTLMRSGERRKISLLGLVGGRRASAEIGDFDDAGIERALDEMFASAGSAPVDDANGVSAGQQAQIVQGPQEADSEAMADAMREMLAWRAANTPTVTIEESMIAHHRVEAYTATTSGSSLSCQLGWYDHMAMGTAREGERSSSFNYAGGSSHALDASAAQPSFGIGNMFSDLARQIHTEAIAAPFVGDVVLTPAAVDSLLTWLYGQLSDLALISGTSLYRKQVGQLIASPLLSLKSRFDAPGVVALSHDGFVAAPVELLREGQLQTLTPSLYGSRKTGLAHVPIAAGGWELAGGETSLAAMVAAVEHGAMVGRLSMGNPTSNGDFSGVIKNSFLIEGGRSGTALAEVMISGNMAQMLRDVVSVSRERLDTGSTILPWLRISGLHFS